MLSGDLVTNTLSELVTNTLPAEIVTNTLHVELVTNTLPAKLVTNTAVFYSTDFLSTLHSKKVKMARDVKEYSG
jgi:hypothetical protein